MRVSLSLFAALLLALPAERKQGNPLDHLPPNFEVLTHFGERADISPDNLRVAFMAKSFGDAMVIELNTRAIRCLTCNVPAAVFLPVTRCITRKNTAAGTLQVRQRIARGFNSITIASPKIFAMKATRRLSGEMSARSPK